MLNLCYGLHVYLFAYGGRIGYSIHPDKRGHGIAVIVLKDTWNECKKLRLNHVLLVCNKENIASAKTITECGGVLENEVMHDKVCMQRCWIHLDENPA